MHIGPMYVCSEDSNSVAIGEGVGTADQGLPDKAIEPQGHFDHC